MKAKILVIDDEESIRFSFKTHLSNQGHEVLIAEGYSSGLKGLCHEDLDLVITDVVLGGHTGVDILRKVKDIGLLCPVILITGEPNIETAAEAVRLGAFDYLPKPIRKETLLRVTSHGLRHKMLVDDKRRIENENERYRLNLDAIFRGLKDAVITVDNDLHVLEANEATKTICGFLPDKIIGKNFSEFTAPCSKSCLRVLKETLRTKSTIRELRTECIHHNHSNQIVLSTGSPLKDRDDKILGTILVIRDITRLNGLERKLEERDAACMNL